MLNVGDAGYAQSFSKSINEAHVIAEEKLLSGSLNAIVGLALQQLDGHCLRLRPVRQKTK